MFAMICGFEVDCCVIIEKIKLCFEDWSFIIFASLVSFLVSLFTLNI